MQSKLYDSAAAIQLLLLFLMVALYLLNPSGGSPAVSTAILASLAVISVSTIGLLVGISRDFGTAPT